MKMGMTVTPLAGPLLAESAASAVELPAPLMHEIEASTGVDLAEVCVYYNSSEPVSGPKLLSNRSY